MATGTIKNPISGTWVTVNSNLKYKKMGDMVWLDIKTPATATTAWVDIGNVPSSAFPYGNDLITFCAYVSASVICDIRVTNDGRVGYYSNTNSSFHCMFSYLSA